MTDRPDLAPEQALGVALSVAAPTIEMGDAQEAAPAMLAHLNAIGYALRAVPETGSLPFAPDDPDAVRLLGLATLHLREQHGCDHEVKEWPRAVPETGSREGLRLAEDFDANAGRWRAAAKEARAKNLRANMSGESDLPGHVLDTCWALAWEAAARAARAALGDTQEPRPNSLRAIRHEVATRRNSATLAGDYRRGDALGEVLAIIDNEPRVAAASPAAPETREPDRA